MITLPSVVLDTNIFISALITPGNCRKILDFWSKKQFQLYISDEILEEINTVGKRSTFKHYFTVRQMKILLVLIKRRSIFVSPSIVPIRYQSQDTKDNIFVSCVLESKATYFVTGNVKHFKQISTLTNLTMPTEFADIFKKEV